MKLGIAALTATWMLLAGAPAFADLSSTARVGSLDYVEGKAFVNGKLTAGEEFRLTRRSNDKLGI